MAKVSVILAGAGFMDGSAIQEAVFTLLFLDRAGAEIQCFAPDKPQVHVIDHLTGEPSGETRNVRVEAARIARGQVRDLAELSMKDFDALVMPGGFGMAKNLSTFAAEGAGASVDPDLQRVIEEAVDQKKPIVAICISPAVLAVALSKIGASANLTIGNDPSTAQAVTASGSTHQACPVTEAVVDAEHRIISTPAYMLGPGPKGVAAGIERAIDQLMRWL